MKICLVSSSGGHLTQTLHIMGAFEGHSVVLCTYNSPIDDLVKKAAKAYFTKNRFNQNTPNNLFWMGYLFIWSFFVLMREKPDVILSFGSEIAIPFFYYAKILRIKTIFIESWSRIENLSFTGKRVINLADLFLVQWPELKKKVGGKAQYWGGVL